MNKIKRQTKIIELITARPIETQDELVALLAAEGVDVTQATISRDIRELRLTKAAVDKGDGGGKATRYAVSEAGKENLNERFLRVFREGIVSADHSGAMVVVRTYEGMAMAVAACVDALGFEGLLGCIAGDDTIFCATRTTEAAEKTTAKIRAMALK